MGVVVVVDVAISLPKLSVVDAVVDSRVLLSETFFVVGRTGRGGLWVRGPVLRHRGRGTVRLLPLFELLDGSGDAGDYAGRFGLTAQGGRKVAQTVRRRHQRSRSAQ